MGESSEVPFHVGRSGTGINVTTTVRADAPVVEVQELRVDRGAAEVALLTYNSQDRHALRTGRVDLFYRAGC
jgi:hypothetical protein